MNCSISPYPKPYKCQSAWTTLGDSKGRIMMLKLRPRLLLSTTDESIGLMPHIQFVLSYPSWLHTVSFIPKLNKFSLGVSLIYWSIYLFVIVEHSNKTIDECKSAREYHRNDKYAWIIVTLLLLRSRTNFTQQINLSCYTKN